MHDNYKNLKTKLSVILPILNEKQRRLLVASEAKSIGYGGIKIISEITGIDKKTIRKGIKELDEDKIVSGRIRATGGGRKGSKVNNSDIINLIEGLIEPDTRGDPESPLKWTCKSVRNIADFIKESGYDISRQSVANILHKLEYSLQANKKIKEGDSHPDRDKQFKFINKAVKKFLVKNNPAISVDTKKKELVGNYKNIGKEYSKKSEPIKVNTYDFPDPNISKAVPYGIYDINSNKGWVSVGISSDTAEFAVSSIAYWWREIGSKKYTKSNDILVCADCGGSNGYRSRLWKRELQKLSDKEKINITVCHFPPGTSKWNKIEHRLFSFISINWRGKPLTSYEVIINLIASTKNSKGLTVDARLDDSIYTKGIKISDKEMLSLNIKKNNFHGEWNYTVLPRAA